MIFNFFCALHEYIIPTHIGPTKKKILATPLVSLEGHLESSGGRPFLNY